MSLYWHKFAKSLDDFNFRNWGFHDLCYFLFVVPLLPFFIYFEWLESLSFTENEWCWLPGFLFLLALPCLSWILLYGFVIIPNVPYVKFCKDEYTEGMTYGRFVRAFLSNETETWECPPYTGSTWSRQSIYYDWQCNETYCTADELASPESCDGATTYIESASYVTVWCDNWSADNPGCCQNVYDGTYVGCEYCVPDKTILWTISTFAGIATFIPCLFWSMYAHSLIEEKFEAAESDAFWAKKEAEEKAKKDTEAAEHSV
jgi:hypothetical protein